MRHDAHLYNDDGGRGRKICIMMEILVIRLMRGAGVDDADDESDGESDDAVAKIG